MNSFATTVAAAAAAADSMNATKERSLYLLCAQEMSNNAAVCFEKGLIDQATSSLHDGLKLLIAIDNGNNNHNGDNGSRPIGCCCCSTSACSQEYCNHPCTLDGCIAFSEQTSFLFHSNKNKNSCSCSNTPTAAKRSRIGTSFYKANNGPKKRRLSRSKDVATGFQNTEPSRDSSGSDGYLYKHPIRVPLEGFCHCHKGYTRLLVVIVFNLAITHHLNNTNHSMINGPSDDAKTENVVFLYKLCLELLRRMALCSENNLSSIWCEMIILNNLSQLYLVSGNPTKHKQCLQELLSSLMVLVERKTREITRNAGGSSSSNGHNNNNSNNSSSSSSSSSRSNISSSSNNTDNRNYWWDTNRWAGTQNGERSKVVEGVLENLNPLILQEHCADAA